LLPGYDPHDQAGDCWFDEAAAADAIAFIEECIKHAKGTRDTAAGAPFLLQPWQKSIVANLFGWKRPDGTRRYRECFIYVAKKNGKTALAAAILLLVMMTDNEVGAEIYSAAASKEQAALIFSHAVGMVRQEPELSSRLTVYGAKGGSQQKSIVYDAQSSAYKCLSADANTADGVNPHFVIIDEVHRHADAELADVLQKSTAARAQPLVIYATTADYNRPSLCNTMLKRARQVRDNKGDPSRVGFDPGFLPVVYEATKDDDYADPAIWSKANPNLGITVSEEFMARECKKAQETPSELNGFLRLHMNIVTDADEAWLRGDRWAQASGLKDGETPEAWRKRKLDELRGSSCFLGLDLSSKIDLTAVVQIFRSEVHGEPWIIIPHFWVPNVTAHEKEKADHVPYAAWERAGFVTMTEGNEIDSQAIRAAINRIDHECPIVEVGYDEWDGTELSRQLREEDGFGDRMVPVRQGSRSLSDPMKEFEAMVMSGRLEHGSNPVMDWMIGNLCVKRDENGNLQPNKKKSANRIDGPVATFTGMARALAAPQDEWDGRIEAI
jgi:phage terminase large subunit-like protein